MTFIMALRQWYSNNAVTVKKRLQTTKAQQNGFRSGRLQAVLLFLRVVVSRFVACCYRLGMYRFV